MNLFLHYWALWAEKPVICDLPDKGSVTSFDDALVFSRWTNSRVSNDLGRRDAHVTWLKWDQTAGLMLNYGISNAIVLEIP